MLEFIIGRSGSGKTSLCLEEIAAKVAKEPLGKPLLLLTPAHLTYKLERQLAALLRKQGAGYIRAQVFSFARLARQILLETGGAVCPRLTSIGKRLLLKRVLSKNGKKLNFFAKAVGQRGFTAQLAETVKEFKSFNISPEYLQEKSVELADDALRTKIEELALLYQDFREEMNGRYADEEDILDALVSHIKQSEYLDGAEIWLDGFAYFNPQERNIIAELLKRAKCLHISLLMDTENETLNRFETGIFHDAWEIEQLLREMAAEQKTKIGIRKLAETHRFESAGVKTIERELFSNHSNAGEAEGVCIIEAANRRRELEAMSADILRLCREEGYSWKEIGILLRNPDDYGNLPSMVLGDYGIPFFCDYKRAGTHHPLAELIRSSFEVLHRWKYEPIFRALKTGFFPITREQTDLLENYVISFDIKDNHWTDAEDWHWVRRFDELENVEGSIDEQQKQKLLTVNMLRRRVIAPLQDFVQNMKQAVNVREMTVAVYDYLAALNVPEQLEQWAQEAEKSGRLADARMHQQIWDDVVELLEQFVTMSGDEKMSRKDYEERFADGLDALSVALIPPGLDYVTLSSFDRNSLAGVRALYVLGANEGTMPRYCHESGLLSDAERSHLLEHEVRLAAGSRHDSFNEINVLYRGFVTGSKYLWLSYPLADAEGRALKRSLYVTKLLKEVMPQVRFFSVGIDDMTSKVKPAEIIATKRQALTALAGVLRSYNETPADLGFWQDVYNLLRTNDMFAPLVTLITKGLTRDKNAEKLPPELAARLYAERHKLKGSVSRFESFRNCPFKHFLEHGLKLRERERYRFEVRENGTFLHAIMAHFGEELKKEGKRWADISQDECHQRCGRIVNELAPRMLGEILYSTAQKENLRERISRTAEKSLRRLIEFDKVSHFSPAEFEHSFGLGANASLPLQVNLENGFLLEVRGKIDRIDKSEDGNYYLVMDYKTGTMEINLTEVFYGIKLQLLTYLLLAKSIAEDGSVPVGVLYCFLKNRTITEDYLLDEAAVREKLDKELRMPGWLLADEDIVRLIDESSKYIKVKLSAKGGFDSSSVKNVKTKEEFSILLDYMEWLLKDTGNRILDGELQISPYCGAEKACKYCSYQAVCCFDPVKDSILVKKPEKLADDELLIRMQEKKEGRTE